MEALLIVDLQNDFCPGGALAVAEGDQVVSVANAAASRLPLVVATQDWHPAEHGSFASNHPGHEVGEVIGLEGLDQILWPDHCVQGTAGAELRSDLDAGALDRVFRKGTDPSIDSYSGFFDNGHRKDTGLHDYLREKGVANLYVLGLALDYCVKFTALDAAELGYRTFLIREGCRAVNLNEEDDRKALEALKAASVAIISLEQLPPEEGRG